MPPLYDFPVASIAGQDMTLEDFRGQVLLIVNTASQCGFTPQYQSLERLYQEYGPNEFSVLGFPCNQFRRQEPGDAAQIATFCETQFGVTFPLFSKVEVNGANAHPLFSHLKEEAPGLLGSQTIKWNFTKFLVDAQGQAVQRFAPQTEPMSLAPAIETLLGRRASG